MWRTGRKQYNWTKRASGKPVSGRIGTSAEETADTSKRQMNQAQAGTRAQTGEAGKGTTNGEIVQTCKQQPCWRRAPGRADSATLGQGRGARTARSYRITGETRTVEDSSWITKSKDLSPD